MGSKLLSNAPLTLSTTGTLPAPLSPSVQYWAIPISNDTFQFAAVPGGPAITLTDAGTGTHTFYSWSRTYMIEMGDRTLPNGGVAFRHAMYGSWELDQALTYQDNAFTGTVTTDGGFRNIRGNDVWQFFTTAGAGISAYTINLPTDLLNNHELDIAFIGGTIGTITWGVVGGGSINAPLPPTTTGVGTGNIKLRYRRSTNTWRCISAVFGDYPAMLGRTDGNGVNVGNIGEKFRSYRPLSSAVNVPSGTPTEISNGSTGLVLGPGVYSIYATFGFNAAGSVTATDLQWAINTSNLALPAVKDESYGTRQLNSLPANAIFAVESAFKDVTVATPTAFYPMVQVDFTGGGTVSAYCVIWAHRVG